MNLIQDDRDIFFESMCGLIEKHFAFVDRGYEYSRNIQIVCKLYKLQADKGIVIRVYRALLDKVCITLDRDLMRQDVRAIENVFAYPRRFWETAFKNLTDIAIVKLEKKHSRLVQIYSNYTILSIGDVLLLDIRSIIGKLMLAMLE